MKNLFILKTIIENKKLSSMAFSIWCGLRNIMVKDVKKYFISYNHIGYSLFGRMPVRKELDAIKKGFSELIELGYVNVIESCSKSEFIVDLSALYYEMGQGYFANLTDVEMQKILNLDCKQDKYKLLRYFTCQVGTFNQSLDGDYKGKIGGMSLDSFANMLGYSKGTIIDYNEVLLKEEILFVYNHGDFYKTTTWFGQSTLREIPNTYARYSDKKLALDYISTIQGYKSQKVETIKKSEDANLHRALGQKFRAFCNGKEYDIQTIKELYVYIVTKNDNMKKEYEKNIEMGYTPEEPQYIDISVFDDYLYYFTEIGEE